MLLLKPQSLIHKETHMQEEIYSFLLHVGILKDGRRKSWKEKKARCGDVQDKSNILERQTSSGNIFNHSCDGINSTKGEFVHSWKAWKRM